MAAAVERRRPASARSRRIERLQGRPVASSRPPTRIIEPRGRRWKHPDSAKREFFFCGGVVGCILAWLLGEGTSVSCFSVPCFSPSREIFMAKKFQMKSLRVSGRPPGRGRRRILEAPFRRRHVGMVTSSLRQAVAASPHSPLATVGSIVSVVASVIVSLCATARGGRPMPRTGGPRSTTPGRGRSKLRLSSKMAGCRERRNRN